MAGNGPLIIEVLVNSNRIVQIEAFTCTLKQVQAASW